DGELPLQVRGRRHRDRLQPHVPHRGAARRGQRRDLAGADRAQPPRPAQGRAELSLRHHAGEPSVGRKTEGTPMTSPRERYELQGLARLYKVKQVDNALAAPLGPEMLGFFKNSVEKRQSKLSKL